MTILQRVVLLSLLIMLSACVGEPAYTPDATILATREQAEYDRQIARGKTAWYIGVALMIAFSVILVILAWQLRGVGYDFQNAKAKEANAKARRLLLVDLGNGAVLDLETNTIRSTSIAAPPAQLYRPQPAEALQVEPMRYSLRSFAVDAAGVVGWDSKIFPHWRKFTGHDDITMSGELWKALTDELVEIELLEPKMQGKATLVYGGHDLSWLYDQLREDA